VRLPKRSDTKLSQTPVGARGSGSGRSQSRISEIGTISSIDSMMKHRAREDRLRLGGASLAIREDSLKLLPKTPQHGGRPRGAI
jgi:hypothetical protein